MPIIQRKIETPLPGAACLLICLGMLGSGCYGPAADRLVEGNVPPGVLDGGAAHDGDPADGPAPVGYDPGPDPVYPTATGPCLGYTIFSNPTPDGLKPYSALVDMKGTVVRSWPLNGYPVVMLPGGQVMGSKTMRPGDQAVLSESVELVRMGWDKNILWSFSSWDKDGTSHSMSRQHHDYQLAGNPVGYYAPGQIFNKAGPVLVLGHLTLTSLKVSGVPLTDDVIYEVNANGALSGFQWRASDHIDEMGFDQASRQAIRTDPMFDTARGTGEWLHVNSMARLGRNRWYERYGDARFHPDNIIIGSRQASFIAIISRQTGKIVWRVGPDFSPERPEAGLGRFVGQHHAHIIPHGLPGEGNILLFDNGGLAGYDVPPGLRTYSRVLEFNPVTLKVVWTYGASSGAENFFSPFISSAQRLPNGNTLITAGEDGKIFEVTLAKKTVWSYSTVTEPPTGGHYIYRGYRVPPEWLPAGVNSGGYPSWSKLYPVK